MGHTFRNRTNSAQTSPLTANPSTFNHTPGDRTTVIIIGLVIAGTTARTGGAPTIAGITATSLDELRVAAEQLTEFWYVTGVFDGSQITISIPNSNGVSIHWECISADAGAGYTSKLNSANGDVTTGSNDGFTFNVTSSASGDFLYSRVGSGENSPISISETSTNPTKTGGSVLDHGTFSSKSAYGISDGAGTESFVWVWSGDDGGGSACCFASEAVIEISVYDAIKVSDLQTDGFVNPKNVSVYDSLTINDSNPVVAVPSLGGIDVYSSLTVSDVPTVEQEAQPDRNVNIYDAISISDSGFPVNTFPTKLYAPSIKETGGLFVIDAEIGDTSEFTTRLSTWGGLFTVCEDSHKGNFGFKVLCVQDTTTELLVGRGIKSITPSDEIYARAYFKIPTNYLCSTAATTTFLNFALQSASWTLIRTYLQLGSSVHTLYSINYWNNGSSTSDFKNIALNLDQWYCLELRAKRGNGTGEAQVWLDGTEIGLYQNLINDEQLVNVYIGYGKQNATLCKQGEYALFDTLKISTSYIGLYNDNAVTDSISIDDSDVWIESVYEINTYDSLVVSDIPSWTVEGEIAPDRDINIFDSITVSDLPSFDVPVNIPEGAVGDDTVGRIAYANESLSDFNSYTNITLDASAKAHGTYGFKGAWSGSSQSCFGRFLIDPARTTDTNARFYFYMPSGYTWVAGTFMIIMDLLSSGVSTRAAVLINCDASSIPEGWKFYTATGFSSLITTNFSLDEWHCIEIEYVRAVSGGARFYVDDDLVLTKLDSDESAQNLQFFDFGVKSSINPQSGAYIYFDDCVVDDGYIGLFPAGAGAIVDNILISESGIAEVVSYPLSVNVYDSILVSDFLTLSVPVDVSVSDNLTVADVPIVNLEVPEEMNVNIFDFISVSDVPVVDISIDVSVNDWLIISDSGSCVVVSADVRSINIYDSILINDTGYSEPLININISDNLTISDSGSLSVVSADTFNINIYDSIAVSDDGYPVNTFPGKIFVPTEKETGGLFVIDAETADLSQFTTRASQNGFLFTVSSDVHKGNFSYKVVCVQTTTALATGRGVKTITASDEIYQRAYFKIPTNYFCCTDAVGSSYQLFDMSGGTFVHIRVYISLNSTTHIISTLRYYNGTYTNDSKSINLDLDQWHCIEIRAKRGNGNGEAQVWLNGTEIGYYQNLINDEQITNSWIGFNKQNTSGLIERDQYCLFDTLKIATSYIGLYNDSAITDYVSVSDVPTVSVLAVESRDINIFDSLTVSDSVSLDVSLPSVYNISVYDSILIADFLVINNFVGVDVYDVVTIADALVLAVSAYINVYDSLTVSEVSTLLVLSGALDINIFDSILVSDVPTILRVEADIRIISVYDAFNISEGFPLDILINVSAYSNIVVSDSSILTSIFEISVYDSLTVSDVYIYLGISDTNINVYDFLSVADSGQYFVAAPGVFNINVYDSLTLSDSGEASVSAPGVYNINIFDSISVADFDFAEPVIDLSVFDNLIIADVPTTARIDAGTLEINVFSSLAVSDTTFFDFVALNAIIHDSINVSDSGGLPVVGLNVSAYSGVTVADSAQFFFDKWNLSVYDTITIADEGQYYTLEAGVMMINVNDKIAAADIPEFTLSAMQINLYDALIVSDSGTSSVQQADARNVNVYDGISVGETLLINTSLYGINVVDNILVESSVYDSGYVLLRDINGVAIKDINDNYIYAESGSGEDRVTIDVLIDVLLFDNITLTDFNNSSVSVNIDVYDNTQVSDVVAALVLDLSINIFDSLTVADVSILNFESPGVYNVDIYDSITVADNVIANASLLEINIYDAVTIADSGLWVVSSPGQIDINVYDLIAVSDLLDITISTDINVADILNVSDGNILDALISVDVSDSLLVSDTTVRELSASVFVWDNLNIGEASSFFFDKWNVSVYDALTISDSGQYYIEEAGVLMIIIHDVISAADVSSFTFDVMKIDIADSMLVSDSVVISGEEEVRTINIYDSITVQDYNEFTGVMQTLVYDTIFISDSGEYYCVEAGAVYVNVFDRITVAESLIFTSSIMGVNVFDNIKMSDVPEPIPDVRISAYDSLSLADYVLSVQMSASGIFIWDSIEVADTIYSDTDIINVYLWDIVLIADVGSGALTIDDRYVDVFDSMMVSDDAVVELSVLPLFTYDSIKISDVSLSVGGSAAINIYDSLIVSDSYSDVIVYDEGAPRELLLYSGICSALTIGSVYFLQEAIEREKLVDVDGKDFYDADGKLFLVRNEISDYNKLVLISKINP